MNRRSLTALGWVWLYVAVAGGCAAHEAVGRPPTADQIARINSSAAANSLLTVDYFRPVPGDSALPPGDRSVGIERIVSADDQKLTVDIGGGVTRQIDLSLVADVSAPDRTHDVLACGAAGGAIGLGFGGLLLGGLYALAYALPSDPGSPQSSGSHGPVIGLVIGATVLGAVVGAIFGSEHGGRRYFDLGGVAVDTPG